MKQRKTKPTGLSAHQAKIRHHTIRRNWLDTRARSQFFARTLNESAEASW